MVPDVWMDGWMDGWRDEFEMLKMENWRVFVDRTLITKNLDSATGNWDFISLRQYETIIGVTTRIKTKEMDF